MLTALNECSEWGQVFILDALSSNYSPRDEREAQAICERIVPRLAHANPAVVLSSVKLLVKFMEVLCQDGDFISSLVKRLAAPLVTLLSQEPEVQYVALRNINLIIQKRPDVLKHDIQVFFVKYNDPLYVKLEKLDIIIRLTSEVNMIQVLSELKEYAHEVDVDFVRKSVRAIGRCAIKVGASADRCVKALLDLIQLNGGDGNRDQCSRVSHVVQEATVVLKDIFRKYPNRYEGAISTLCDNMDSLDEPEARAAMVWIIGEYAERIDNAGELIDGFLDAFQDENAQVQLQLLTATVKLFLKKPTEAQELVQQVLGLATQDSENPDLRDRGFIYWRLLSIDPAAAREVVLAERPLINVESDSIEPTLLDILISHIATVASVSYQPPVTVPGPSVVPGDPEVEEYQSVASNVDLERIQGSIPTPAVPATTGDLLGGLDLTGETLTAPDVGAPTQTTTDFLADILDISPKKDTTSSQKVVWLSGEAGEGLEVSGTFSRSGGSTRMDMTFSNRTPNAAMNSFALQINKNSFGLVPSEGLQVSPLAPGQSFETSLRLGSNGPVQKMEPINALQVAVKADNLGIFYFACTIPMQALFVEDGSLDRAVFLATWREIPDSSERQYLIENVLGHTTDNVADRMRAQNVFTVATRRSEEGMSIVYQSIKFTNGVWALAELTFQPGNSNIKLAVKTRAVDVCQGIYEAYNAILHNRA